MKNLLLILSLFIGTTPLFAQQAKVNQTIVPTAEIYDTAFIGQFLEEQLIYPKDADYTHAIFFDITEDGFGVNDILVLYPDEEHFSLSTYFPEELLNKIAALNLETDYRLSTVRERSPLLANEAEVDEDAKKALAGAILGSLLYYYPEGPMEMHLVQEGEDVNITFWNYNETLWEFAPQATMCIQPDANIDPFLIVTHKQPELRAYLDGDGCAIVESITSAGEITTRTCESNETEIGWTK